jgi:hypothetical protein
VPEVLDGGFAALRARPRTMVLIALPIVAPLNMLSAYVQRHVNGGEQFVDTLRDGGFALGTDSGAGSPFVTFALIALGSLAVTLVGGAVAVVVAGWYQGVDHRAGEALAQLVPRTPALVVGWIAVHVLEAVGVLGFCVGLLAMMALLVVTAPVIAIERAGPFAAVKRSWQLCRRQFARALGFVLLSGIGMLILRLVFSAAPLALSAWVGSEWGWPIIAAGDIVASIVLMPVLAAATTYFYLDLRVRTEGLDLELDAADTFPQVDVAR